MVRRSTSSSSAASIFVKADLLLAILFKRSPIAFSWSDLKTTSEFSSPISFRNASTRRAGNSMDAPFMGTIVAMHIFDSRSFAIRIVTTGRSTVDMKQ